MYPERRLGVVRKRCPQAPNLEKGRGSSWDFCRNTYKLKVREGSIRVGKGGELLK